MTSSYALLEALASQCRDLAEAVDRCLGHVRVIEGQQLVPMPARTDADLSKAIAAHSRVLLAVRHVETCLAEATGVIEHRERLVKRDRERLRGA